MKTTYATWTRVGDSLKIVRRARGLVDAMKGFRPGRTFVSRTIRKS